MSAAAPAGRLAGRVVLVTGAGRGFGRTMAVAFAREGADVVAYCAVFLASAQANYLTGQVLQPTAAG